MARNIGVIVQDIETIAPVPEHGANDDNGLDRHVSGIIGALIGDNLKDVLSDKIRTDESADIVDVPKGRQGDRCPGLADRSLVRCEFRPDIGAHALDVEKFLPNHDEW